MKRSVFGEKLDELMATTEEPMTTVEMADEVGCSVQRVYAWVAANRGLLHLVGVSPTGANLYIGRRNALARTTRSSTRSSLESGLEVGTELTITKIILMGNGEARVEFETTDGRVVEATVAI